MNAQLAYESGTFADYNARLERADDNDAAFSAWESSLTDAQRGEYALDYLDQLHHVYGVVQGEVTSREPWFGRYARVEFNAGAAFDEWLRAKWAALPEVRS